MAFVYWPDDEPDTAGFNGETYTLPPNGTLEVSDAAAAVIVNRMGRWGAAIVKGPVKGGSPALSSDRPAIEAAERQYLRSTRAWAEGLIMEYVKSQKPRREAGLSDDPEGAEVTRARAWLAKYKRALKEAGITA